MHVRLGTGGSSTIEHVSPVAHIGLYALLTWLGGRYLLSTDRRISTVLLVWMLIYAAYAAFDEWLQQFVGRTTSLADWLADLVGIVSATLLLFWYGRRKTSSLHAPGSKKSSAKTDSEAAQ